MDLYGVARIIHEGVRYTDADGNHITIISEA
jgi:hypothetical protein